MTPYQLHYFRNVFASEKAIVLAAVERKTILNGKFQ